MTKNISDPVHINGLYAHRGFLSLDDPGVFEAVSLPWELMIRENGKTSFKHWKDYFVTPSITVYQEQFQSAVHVIGLSPPGMLSLSIPLKTGSNTSYWNQSLQTSALPIAMPGELNSYIDDEQFHMILLINLKLIRQFYSHEQIEKLKQSASRHFIQSTAEKSRQLSLWLNKILIDTLNDPSILSEQIAIQSFEEELLRRLSNTIDLSQTKKKRPHLSLRQKGLKKALEFIHSSDNRLNNIPEICRLSGVSQRTLEYAFQDAFNLSPIQFIQQHRLHKFHHKLLFSSSDYHTVTSTADELGLEQIGRRAGEYKKLFNEQPSETLKRTANQSMSRGHVLVW